MSVLSSLGTAAPRSAQPPTTKASSDGAGAFGPALTLARGLLDPPVARSGAGSRATPGPALPVDLAATGEPAAEGAAAASAAVQATVPAPSSTPTPVGMPVAGAGVVQDSADPANQGEAGSLPAGSTLAQGLPEDRATFLSRATQGARLEASAAHVPTALPPTSGAQSLPAADPATGAATAATPMTGSQTQSASAPAGQAQSASPQLAQAQSAQAAPAQSVPTVPGTGSTRSAALAAEPSAVATMQPVVPAAQPAVHQASAAQASAPAAPPVPAPPVPLATQLYKPVFSLAGASKGEHLITVRVAPDELGPVTVRALVTAEGMRVELFAPTEAARDALRGMLPDLRRDLAAPGLHASLDVSTRDQPGGGDSTRGHADGQGPTRQDQGRPDRTREPPLPPGNPTGDAAPEQAGLPGGTSWNRSTLDLLA